MRVGFTGTQIGMTRAQKVRVEAIFSELSITELHHGDCIGADADAHAIARGFAAKVVTHPPINSSKRAFCRSDFAMPVREYLARNRDIVDAATVLVAAPKSAEEELRSGTWSTVRYARRQTQGGRQARQEAGAGRP